MIEIFIPMKVQPKQSVKAGKGNWFPQKGVTDNANSMALFMSKHIPEEPLKGPLRLTITYKYPFRMTEKKKNLHGEMWKYTSPDHGNLTKQIEDVMEKMFFFGNDAQVASSRVEKFWCDGKDAGVWIKLEELGSHIVDAAE